MHQHTLALVLLLCLAGIAPSSYSACIPTDPYLAGMPGDTVNLHCDPNGADWSYLWLVSENVENGKIVLEQSGPALSFTVPETGYADAYYIHISVTNGPCIGEACTLLKIEGQAECSITTKQPTTIYVGDRRSYEYSTKHTPSDLNQRWWIFPEDKFPEDPSKISYQGHQNYRIDDGNSIAVIWKDIADRWGPGKYIISTGYYDQGPPYQYRDSCQLNIIVMDRLSVDISLVQDEAV